MLVTRSAKQMRRMVQIFVKVDEMKMVAMEVSSEDKVHKILNTVSGSDWDVYVTCDGRIQDKRCFAEKVEGDRRYREASER